MIISPHRRDILKAGAAIAGAAMLPARAFAQGAGQQAAFSIAPLSGGLTSPGGGLAVVSGAGVNSVVGVEPDGLTLVDGVPQEFAEAFIRFVAGETGATRIKTMFNTHWHLEQTGANEAARAAGARIVAHEHTRLWMNHAFFNWTQQVEYPARPDAAVPDEGFYETWDGEFGEGGVTAGYLFQPHTDGDAYVKFPGANVIASGGVGVADAWPYIDWSAGGWIGGVIDGLQTLIDVSDDSTVIVPAQGPTVTRADLQAQHEMYSTILQRLAELMRKSYGFAEVLAARPTAEFDAQWGDPEQFVRLAYRSIWGHIRNDRRVSTI